VSVSERRRREVIDALRRGTVPAHGLDLLAVGLERLEPALLEDLDRAASGAGTFKAVRGEYGAGKTFLARWLADRARARGMATAEVQISETETPLHRLETVYRRITESLTTAEFPPSAFGQVLDAWIFALEEDVVTGGQATPGDVAGLAVAVDALLESRLATVSRSAPGFAAALRAYHAARTAGDRPTAAALVSWLGGQPHVAAGAKRAAGVRGDLDHFGALGFLQGLLTVLRDIGHPGLLLVLDEVETLQRVRGDVREKALNALRQLLDEVDSGRFPGLALVITGTPAFFDGTQGVQRLPPLAQRLATHFDNPEFDNPRAVQVRLLGFTRTSLGELGRRVRDLYASGSPEAGRVARLVDDAYVDSLGAAVTGQLGGRVGVAPRIFLKKLVDVLDRVDQHPDYDPRTHYRANVASSELTAAERETTVVPAGRADDVDLDLR